MSKFDYKKIMPRYSVIAVLMTLAAVAVVAKSFYIMTVKKDYWEQVASRQKADSVKVKPMRGNILSSDGQLMASSLPEYKLFMDFKALHDAENDSLWDANLDTICIRLNQISPEKSASQFKTELEAAKQKRSHRKALIHNVPCLSLHKGHPQYDLPTNRTDGGGH